MSTLLIVFSLFVAPVIGRCVAPQDSLRFYVVNDEPVTGGRYIDTPECPKVGYITNAPNLVITHLQSVSTNTSQVISHYNGKVSVETNTSIVIQMSAQDAKLFADLTRQNIGRRILISLGERPLVAPVVQMPIESGDIQITVGQGRDVEAVVAALKKIVRHSKTV